MSRDQETGEIVLGGRRFAIQAFTFDQLQTILPAFSKLRLGLSEGGLAAARDIIAAALSDRIAGDELAAMRTTVPEILEALPVVARISGLVALGEAVAGTDRQ